MSVKTTSITGTVEDGASQQWSKALVICTLQMIAPTSQPVALSDGSDVDTPFVFQLDSNGAFVSATLPDVTDIAPNGSSWNIVVQPFATVAPFDFGQFPVKGTTVNLGLLLSGMLGALLPDGLTVQSGKLAVAYSADEIFGQAINDTYIDVTANSLNIWDGIEWIELAGGGAGGFSVTGTPAAPHPAFVPIYRSGSPNTAEWGNLTAADILPAFAVTVFNGGQNVEIGTTVTDPAFTIAYSNPASSANITNTDGIDSPLTLASPFTSGTVTGSFHKTTQASTTFTIQATDSDSDTASASTAINWLPRNFAGVGSAGATGASASGNNAILTGATGTLADKGLFQNPVGVNFGAQTPVNQKIYILCIGSSRVFHDANTGFLLPFNAPTTINFVNQEGATVSMALYESSALLDETFTPVCVS